LELAGGEGGAGGRSFRGYHRPGSGGGGGGGGYYGGGGSAYVEPGATNVKDNKGAAPPGNGEVVISW
jgi:hypothetical protein